jgi:hypothetical protein
MVLGSLYYSKWIDIVIGGGESQWIRDRCLHKICTNHQYYGGWIIIGFPNFVEYQTVGSHAQHHFGRLVFHVSLLSR